MIDATAKAAALTMRLAIEYPGSGADAIQLYDEMAISLGGRVLRNNVGLPPPPSMYLAYCFCLLIQTQPEYGR
jgi:hypothetical protein